MVWLIQSEKLNRVDKIQLITAYILQLIIAAGIIYSVYKKNWLNVFLISGILILTFLPALFQRSFNVYLPIDFHFAIILFLFAALFLGEIRAYYTWLWWWDIVLHTISGALLGIAGFVLVYVLNQEKKIHLSMKSGFISLFSLTFAVTIGVIWEVFEFAMDSFFGFHMQKTGLVDTMWDLIVDFLGALIISILGYFYIRNKKSLLFNRFVHRFVRNNPRLFTKVRRNKK